MRSAILAAALLLALPGAAEANASGCRLPSKATVVASSALAIVYYPAPATRPAYRACLRSSGRRLALSPTGDNSPDGDPLVERMTLVGRYVAWVELFFDRYGQKKASVPVFDLKRGRLRWIGGGPFRPAGDPPEVTDFALNASGRVAYVTRERRIEYPEPDHTPGEWRTVWARDASGTRKLEEGRDAIDLTSLDLAGFTATWVSGGRRQSAQLY